MSQERSAHRSFAPLLAAAATASAIGLVLSWWRTPPMFSVALVVLALGVVVSENFALDVGAGSVSLGFPLTIAAIVLMGPTSAVFVAASGATNYSEIREGKPGSHIAYNLSSMALATLAAGWTYLALGGRTLLIATTDGFESAPLVADDFPKIVLPLVGCAVVSVLANAVMMTLGVSRSRDIPTRALMPQVAMIVQNEFALAFVGFFIAQVLAVNLLGLLLFVAPLVVARQVYQRYVQLREAYADTVRSLVGILEAKDPYTRGHSERVAGYALAIGRQMGLSESALDRLEYAALLHDLGKTTIPRQILVKPGRLTDAEYAKIRNHPRRGAEIVARIPSLSDIVPSVRYHHEWFDGNGYCDGIAGDSIPLISRILAVADAFDAMTTARPYRPARNPEDALDELIRMSGVQFDPNLVEEFIQSGAVYLFSPQAVVELSAGRELESGYA